MEEITNEQMKEYTPGQLLTILRQREHLLDVLVEEHQVSLDAEQLYYLPSGTYDGRPLRPPPGLGYPQQRKPWVPQNIDECQAKYCHYCRPSCEPRSYLSLNRIANGDIPPSAATGFGFHRLRTRPVIDVNIVRDIGLRAVPWPRAQSHAFPSSPSSESTWSLSDIIEGEVIEPLYADSEPVLESGGGSTIDSTISRSSGAHAFGNSRPAESPPSTPATWAGVIYRMDGTTTFQQQPFVCDGRSPDSLKTNNQVRRRVMDSIAGLMDQDVDDEVLEEFLPICSPVSPDQSGLLRASLQPIVDGHPECPTPMMTEELEEGRFHEEPLDVAGGVAVLEESVQLGVPDVVTQM